MGLDFSIGKELVIDCDLAGWPENQRDDFMGRAANVAGVTRVGGAGHSTVRVRYDVPTQESKIRADLTALANQMMPGRNFIC